jgi:hypothetical protein
MRDTGRLLLTFSIWIGLLILTGSLLTSPTGAIAQANSATVLGVTLVLGGVAALMTLIIWVGGNWQARAEAESVSGKRKRPQHSRIERLLADLNDDEVYELEALLLGHEGEIRADRTRPGSDA